MIKALTSLGCHDLACHRGVVAYNLSLKQCISCNCLLVSELPCFPSLLRNMVGFPGGRVVKNSPANAGDVDSIPSLRRSPGKGNGNPFQYSYLKNSMDRDAWWPTFHGVTKG